MILDQHWYLEKTKEEKAEALILGESVVDREEIGYHHKWHDLNDVMCDLYPTEAGSDVNTMDLEITEEIVDRLENWVEGYQKEYPDNAEVLHFSTELLPLIREHVEAGRTVYYWPWW